jgi:signal transduction histidine kinase
MARGQNQSDSTFDLVEAVASVVHSFKASGCTLNSNCEVVKYEGSTCLVQMRKAGLEQILFNLLLNAAQQIDRLQPLRKSQGEILVEVQTTKDPLDGIWAQILVHDNGPGIHHCDFDRIFDMNYTTKEDGCGLGLSISRDIANRVVVGGRTGSLTVRRSILLAGSTFELKLPF